MGKKLHTDAQYRELAKMLYQLDGEVEIDDNATISSDDDNPDGGVYVQAWVWVSDEEF